MATLTLFEKLDNIESRYQELTAQLSSPEVLGDSARYQKLARTHADLSAMVEKYRQWKELEKGVREAKQMMVESDDAEMKQLAHEEERQLLERKEIVENELKRLLLPRDPNDEKNVILEIRAGTGGDEAALFAARRTVREYALFGGAHHALAQWAGGLEAGRKIADQEPRQGHARASRAALRDGAAEAARANRRGATGPN